MTASANVAKALNGMHRYSSYGLSIQSDIVLPELAADTSDHKTDAPVVVVRNAQISLDETTRAQATAFAFDETGATFWWQTVGGFHVSHDGCDVQVERAAGVSDDLIAFPLLGPVLSEVLRRNSMFVLHASAALIDGQGVAFLADKGTGKSSSVAALLRAGASLLADDLVALTPGAGHIVPGFSQIKIAPENLAHQLAGSDWVARPQVHDAIDKIRVLVPGAIVRKNPPARRMYLLERGAGDVARIVPLPGAQALPAVLRFAYAARFGEGALRGADAGAHFRAAVDAANTIPVRRLILPGSLARLDGLAEVIRADLAQSEPR